MNKKNIIISILIVVVYLVGIYLENKLYAAIITVIIMLIGFYRILNNPFELKVLIIFMLTYSLPFLSYFLDGRILSWRTVYNKEVYIYKNCLTNFLFLSFFLLNLGKIKIKQIKIQKFKNSKLFYFNLAIFIFLLLTGIKSGKIGDYSKLKGGTKIEYTIVFYIYCYIFSNNKYKIKVINVIYSLYVVLLFLLGARASSIQIIMTILILNRNKFIKPFSRGYFRNNLAIIFIAVSYYLMKFIEESRFGDRSILERIDRFIKGFNVQTRVINTNQTDVIYATNSILGVVEKSIWNIDTTIKSWIGMISGIFLPSSYSMKEAIQTRYIQEFTNTGGGSLISGVLYFLGREPLIILVAILLANLIKNTYRRETNIYMKVYGVIIIVTVFRWYGYSISNFYRMGVYLVMLLSIYIKILKLLFKNEK